MVKSTTIHRLFENGSQKVVERDREAFYTRFMNDNDYQCIEYIQKKGSFGQ